MKNSLFITVLFIFISLSVLAQREYRKFNQLWGTGVVKTELPDSLYLSAITGFRNLQLLQGTDVVLYAGEFGKNYKNLTISGGYAHFIGITDSFNVPEERFFQIVTLKTSYGSNKINHRYTFEERFIRSISDTARQKYTFWGRFRYRFEFVRPLYKDKKFNTYITIFDELLIYYAGRPNVFDQKQVICRRWFCV